jgi:hypothetical protein
MPATVVNPYLRKRTASVPSSSVSRGNVVKGGNSSSNSSSKNNTSKRVAVAGPAAKNNKHYGRSATTATKNGNANAGTSVTAKGRKHVTFSPLSNSKSKPILTSPPALSSSPSPSSLSFASSSLKSTASASTSTSASASTKQQKQQQKRKPTVVKTKRNLKASFKAQLRKEIASLKRQKVKQIQDHKLIKIQKEKEEQRQQRLIAKQKLEEEKVKRKEERMEEKKREKELLKLKLKRDLEMKQKVEEEKMERKRVEKEERELAKEQKRREREAKRQLEAEKRRMEAEQARLAQQAQQALRAKMMWEANMTMNMNTTMQNSSLGNSVGQIQSQSQMGHQPQQLPSFPSYYSHPYNNYNPMSMIYNSTSQTMMNNMPIYAYNHSLQMSSYWNNTYNNSFIPSSIRKPTVKKMSSSTSTSITKKNNHQKPKEMILHQNPLNPPSPYVKTHVILPYKIIIYKEEGQSFGMNIRYEARGTFVEVKENDKMNHDQMVKSNNNESSSNLIPAQVSSPELNRITNVNNTHNTDTSLPTVTRENHDQAVKEKSVKNETEDRKCVMGTNTNDNKAKEVITIKAENDLDLPSNSLSQCLDKVGEESNKEKLIDSPLLQIEGNNNPIDNSNITNITETKAIQGQIKVEDEIVPISSATIDPSVAAESNTKIESVKVLPDLTASTEIESVKVESSSSSPQNQEHEMISEKLNPTDSIVSSTTIHQKVALNDSKLDTNIKKNSAPTVHPTSVNLQLGANLNPPKKFKRKKITFGVMSIIGAEKQNSRAKEGISQEKLIQTNDIILKINDQSLSGLTFQQAANLFAKAGTNDDDQIDVAVKEDHHDEKTKKIIKCVLTVAREKKVIKILNKLASLDKPIEAPVSKRKYNTAKEIDSLKLNTTNTIMHSKTQDAVILKVPLIIDESKQIIVSGEFSLKETEALNYGIRKSFGNYMSLVDGKENDDLIPSIYEIIAKNPSFSQVISQRNPNDLNRKWLHETNKINKKMVDKALHLLKKEWKTENEGFQTKIESQYMLESQRSMMRNLPRRPQGCKCGSLDHRYVNDPKCILYRNLRKLSTVSLIESDESKSTLFDKYDGKLNSIGAAHLQRMKKRKEEEQAERREAEFVAEMEHIQVTQLKKAIFSPSLFSIIVLSSIASLCDKTKWDSDESVAPHKKEVDNDKTLVFNDDKREEDMSLEDLLGKRQAESNCKNGASFKKRRLVKDLDVSSYCLAELLLHIGKTWGHVYKEPEPVDYAW